MCGIFGIIQKDGSTVDIELVQKASRKLNHRGPDGEGFFIDRNIGLGHKRLTIIDLSERAGQPFQKHGMVLSYNGEIYNYLEIKRELEEKGIKFRTDSDTEVFLSAYYQWGRNAFDKFNGMWAALIWKEEEKQMLVSRDRYGMKPLFIYEDEKNLAFASEIKAFSTLDSWNGQLNKNIVHDFLANGIANHNEKTFYENVRSLKTASVEIFDEMGILRDCYQFYSIKRYGVNTNFSPQCFRAKFSEAIRIHYTSDVKVATSLSGGIDSSAIVAESVEQEKLTDAFSYKSSLLAFSEYKYVKLLEKSKDFKSYSISPDFKDHISNHRNALLANEAPSLNMNLITSFMLYKDVSRKKYKVILAGQGADELLLGYNFYYLPFLKELRKSKPFKFLRELVSLGSRYPKESFRAFKKWFNRADYSKYVKYGSRGSKIDFSTFQEFYTYHLGWGQLYGLLQYEDRLSMANGVEARLPFLDKNFADYLHSLSHEIKIVKAVRKYPLRKAMKNKVPQQILNRRDKMGYLTPQNVWIRDNLDFIKRRVKEGVKENPHWFNKAIHDFLERRHFRRKDYNFLWRLYSFLEFLEVKL